MNYNINSLVRHFLDLLKKLKLPTLFVAKLFKLYHKHIIRQTSNIFKKAYKSYDKNGELKVDNFKNYNSKEFIWTFWWQGDNNMPYIVRKCIRSIKRHSNRHKVIVLNKRNISHYVELPQYIYDKLKEGNISLTEFSDILRFNILCNYGGLWVDSTVYCISNFPKRCFRGLYTASGGYPKYCDNISLGRWTSFLIGGNKHQSLFVFMNNLLLIYWKYNNHLIDYFLTDYSLNYAYNNNIGHFAQYINHYLYINPRIYEMESHLNKKFNFIDYNYLTHNTFLFKLTYKMSFKHNKNTFYNVLINK